MKTVLGIELGSTRIKSVLIDGKGDILAQGVYEWENELVDGLWSYSLDKVETGLRASYKDLVKNFGKPISKLDAIGVSAMMHGYLAFGKNGELLAPFRTWRNTNAAAAAKTLSELFGFNVPMRWSVAQYYQSVTEGLAHVKEIDFLTTLAGYVHYRLTGKRVLGVDDASGMFPVTGRSYDGEMMKKFNRLLKDKGIDGDFEKLLPKVLFAGENAGCLTESGAKWLDESGNLCAGIPLCPPEGDMGTGMVATNSVLPRTGNVSSGTSANFTVVLEKPLKNRYKEIDVVATPDGHPCALIHTNNCTTEINEWVSLFGEVAALFGANVSAGELYSKLFRISAESDESTGGIVSYNFLAGEPLAGTETGAPTVSRKQDGKMNLANFMQAQIYSAVATLALGMDILKKEGVKIDLVLAHGGFYKTDFIGQNATSAVLKTPVTVMRTAAEGGAWGMALLALFSAEGGKDLPSFLNGIFSGAEKSTVTATRVEIEKCEMFMERYRKCLIAEKAFSENL